MKAIKKPYAIQQMKKICQKYRVQLHLNDPNIDDNNGLAIEDSDIYMSKNYSSTLVMLAIFFHELGHIIITRRKTKKYRKLSIFREETLAWCLAMEYQAKYLKKSFSKRQGNFMLECLATYSSQHYNFSKTYTQKKYNTKK